MRLSLIIAITSSEPEHEFNMGLFHPKRWTTSRFQKVNRFFVLLCHAPRSICGIWCCNLSSIRFDATSVGEIMIFPLIKLYCGLIRDLSLDCSAAFFSSSHISSPGPRSRERECEAGCECDAKTSFLLDYFFLSRFFRAKAASRRQRGQPTHATTLFGQTRQDPRSQIPIRARIMISNRSRWALFVLAVLALGASANVTSIENLSLETLDEKLQVSFFHMGLVFPGSFPPPAIYAKQRTRQIPRSLPPKRLPSAYRFCFFLDMLHRSGPQRAQGRPRPRTLNLHLPTLRCPLPRKPRRQCPPRDSIHLRSTQLPPRPLPDEH